MFKDLFMEKIGKRGCTKSYVAKKCGWHPASLSQKLVYNDFRESDMEKMANAIGYRVEIKLVKMNKNEEEL